MLVFTPNKKVDEKGLPATPLDDMEQVYYLPFSTSVNNKIT